MVSALDADISLMGHPPHRLAALALGAVVLFGSGVAEGAGGASGPPDVTSVRVTEKDFRITASRSSVATNVLLTVVNKGPANHELVIVRKTAARLPFRSDGLTLDEDALEPVKQPSLEPGPPSSERTLRLHLARGRYMLFCNMSGHFLGGMHTELVVR